MEMLNSWFHDLRLLNVYKNKCVVDHVKHGDKILIYKKKTEKHEILLKHQCLISA